MDRLPEGLWSDQGLEGKYRFEHPIATSTMAVVVAARHVQLDEKVAIKFLSPDAVRNGSAISRFHGEAKAAARIKNHHVVRIIDVATTTSGIPYIVMEYLEGYDLERLLTKYPKHQAPISDAIDFVLQACEAISEGHSLGIVHRYLKPANLFCVDRGDGHPTIKVLDFGISKFVATGGDVDRTAQHEILGSPRYMSPEQIESTCSVDHRTDIWSLGLILYEAVAGRPPFTGELVPELWRKIRFEHPEPLPSIRRDCPPELWGVVSRCLSKAPFQRYWDLGELALALAPLAPERSLASIARIRWTMDTSNQVSTRPSTFSDSYDRVVTRQERRRTRWFVTAGMASCVGIGLSFAAMHERRWQEFAEGRSPLLSGLPAAEVMPATPLQKPVQVVSPPGPTDPPQSPFALGSPQAPSRAVIAVKTDPTSRQRPKPKARLETMASGGAPPKATTITEPVSIEVPSPAKTAPESGHAQPSSVRWHMDPVQTR